MCWSGEEGGFRRMMTKIFRIVPCPGSSRKGGGGTDHLLHLIQIIHGNFPPRQVTRGGVGCWSGEERGLRRMMTKIFRIVPVQGVLGKEGGGGCSMLQATDYENFSS